MSDTRSPFKRPPLTTTQIRRIREAKEQGIPIAQIARRFSVPVGIVTAVARDVEVPRLTAKATGEWGWTPRTGRDR